MCSNTTSPFQRLVGHRLSRTIRFEIRYCVLLILPVALQRSTSKHYAYILRIFLAYDSKSDILRVQMCRYRFFCQFLKNVSYFTPGKELPRKKSLVTSGCATVPHLRSPRRATSDARRRVNSHETTKILVQEAARYRLVDATKIP